MSLKLVTINVNGLRDNRKRELVFNWLVSKKYDCICLQETHCTGVNINRWEREWKTQGGGASAWLCGSSESKGVAILLSKHFAFDINFNFSDKTGRLLTCEINTENAVFHIFNIYAPNLCSDRNFFSILFKTFLTTMKMIVSIITILFWEILIVFSIKRLIDIPIDGRTT